MNTAYMSRVNYGINVVTPVSAILSIYNKVSPTHIDVSYCKPVTYTVPLLHHGAYGTIILVIDYCTMHVEPKTC